MAKTIYVLNGPNLNLLGVRQPEVYGYETLEDVKEKLEASAKKAGYNIKFFQSNHEGEIIDWIHEAREDIAAGVIINAGALTHTSIAIHDALRTLSAPIVEVHLSNIFAREEYRHKSFISQHAVGIISGLGLNGYKLAIQHLIG